MGSVGRLADVEWEAVGVEPLEGALADLRTGVPAEDVLDQLLRAHRSWPAAARRASAEAVFGVALWRRRLVARLGKSFDRAIPSELLFAFLVDVAGVSLARAERWTGVAPTLGTDALSFADEHSLPNWLAEELRVAYGGEADAMARALNAPGPVFLRANLLRTTRDDLAQRLAAEGVPTRPCSRASAGLEALARFNVLGSPAYRDGAFEVQDEGSQLLAELLRVRPGEIVLDFCAGAGGKTLALGAALGNRRELHAFDIDGERLDRLARRAERAGVSILRVHRERPVGLLADRVLVDAPCSELGVLRRGPDVRWRTDPGTFERWPPLQRELLDQAAAHVAANGRLVYATCTFRRAENESVVEAWERAHPEFQRAEPFFRCAPHLGRTDAFFAAAYQRCV